MEKPVKINYTSRDFESIKKDLVEYTKRYYPDNFKDFSEASFGALMLDTVSYVGDVLSFYIDYQANETFLDSAIEYNNILRIGRQLGFKYAPTNSSTGIVDIYVKVPSTNTNTPNQNLIPVLEKGSTFSSDNGTIFTLAETVDFKNSNYDSRVGEIDANSNPINFIYKTSAKVISGDTFLEKVTLGEFIKFRRLTLSKQNVSEIISIVDSAGNEYYEVEYLSQNIVYKSIPNMASDSSEVANILKPYQVPRRFTVERNFRDTTIVFGGSDSILLSEDSSYFADPSNVVLNISGKKYITEDFFDPQNLTNSSKLGVGPSNTTLFITYRYDSTLNPNVSTGQLNRVLNPILRFTSQAAVAQSTIDSIAASIEVDNPEPIVGHTTEVNSRELKNRIKNHFATQGRAVTEADFIASCYALPSQYGSIKRVAIAKDKDSLRRNLNLYVLSENSSGVLSLPSITLKDNLKNWIAKNKMIGDTIDILDGKIINYEIYFSVVKERQADKNVVLSQCIEAISRDFSLVPQMGEPFIINNILVSLRSVQSVLDVTSFGIRLKNGTGYSATYFDFDSAISRDGTYIKIPLNAAMELKYPNIDIKGTVL